MIEKPDCLSWREAEPIIDHIGLSIAGEVVVMTSEKEAQEQLAAHLVNEVPEGRIVEIGYGLGMSSVVISARAKNGNHWIVEGNRVLAQRAAKKSALRDRPVVHDTWQHFLAAIPPQFASGIYFDPYVFADEIDPSRPWREKFEFAIRSGGPTIPDCLRAGAALSFLNFEPGLDTLWLSSLLGTPVKLVSIARDDSHGIEGWTVRREA